MLHEIFTSNLHDTKATPKVEIMHIMNNALFIHVWIILCIFCVVNGALLEFCDFDKSWTAANESYKMLCSVDSR